MMKVKLLVGALVILVVMNIAALTAFLVVHARGPQPFAHWRALRGEHSFARIDHEKRRALFAALRQFHGEARDLIDETRALEDEAIAAMGEDPVPRARIDSLLQRISDNRLEIARRATTRIIEAGESLTPEEREHLMAGLMHMRGRLHGDARWPDAPPEE